MVFAESLYDSTMQKGNRDEIDNKKIYGYRDRIRFEGGKKRQIQSLWFRTFRYVQLEITTAEEPLTIHEIYSRFTAYPFKENANKTMIVS